MMFSPLSLWRKSLLLLVFSTSRGGDVVAFVQPPHRPHQLPPPLGVSTAHSSPSNLWAAKNSDVDIRTAPLSHLIDLDDKSTQQTAATGSRYQLVSPAADELPLTPGQRLICIGDVHGDFEALQDFLEIGGVYDKTTQNWIGGNTIVVQCGDVLDRGSEELQCFNLLTKLSQQAASQGGHVILLWGNHEALNAGGMFHYTTGEDEYEDIIGKRIDEQLQSDRWRLQYSGNQPARWATYEPGCGVLARPLLSNMKVAVKVGKTVCVHAGLTSAHLDEYGGLRGMNQQAQDWMKQACAPNNNLGEYDSIGQVVYDVQKRAQSSASQMPAILGGGSAADGPVWMRDYSSPNDVEPRDAAKAQQLIDGALFHLQADRMVMGHTVQHRINAALQGKAWRVDVGASRGVMSGTPEVLEVVTTADEKEVVSVLTLDGRVPAEERQAASSAIAAQLQAAKDRFLQSR